MTERDMFGDFAGPRHSARYSIVGPHLMKDGRRVLFIAAADDYGPSPEAEALRTRICDMLNAAEPAR